MTGKPSAADRLAQLATDHFELFVDGRVPYAVPKNGVRLPLPFRGGVESLRSVLAAWYFRETSRAAPQQALTDALGALEGSAALDRRTLPLRATGNLTDGLWLDLGDPTARAVRITADGWDVVEDGPLFRRTALTDALPEPERGGDLEELWSLLNVAPADRPLCAAWLVAALVEPIPHPALTFRGEQGTGKSTATRLLAALVDPSTVPLRKPPKDDETWTTAAAGSWVVAVDNVSTISERWSDSLCRAVTGDGDVRRQLYADRELAVFSFRRVLLLNGIDVGNVRDDLADRLLALELARIPDSARRTETQMAAAWAHAYPRLFGALLDLAADVLATLPSVDLAELPRMADFARVLAAVDRLQGTDGLARYAEQSGALAADAVDGDPALEQLTARITAAWEGTSSELLVDLTPAHPEWRRPREWPKDPRALTALVRRRAPSLRRLGWTVDELGRGGKAQVMRWRLVPPTEAGVAGVAGDVSGPSLADEAGVAGVDPPPSLSSTLEEQKREQNAATRDVPESSPALPAPPATRRVDPTALGPCAGCGRQIEKYGEHGRKLCAACAPSADEVCRLCGAVEVDEVDGACRRCSSNPAPAWISGAA